jgi:hypothetical protein
MQGMSWPHLARKHIINYIVNDTEFKAPTDNCCCLINVFSSLAYPSTLLTEEMCVFEISDVTYLEHGVISEDCNSLCRDNVSVLILSNGIKEIMRLSRLYDISYKILR